VDGRKLLDSCGELAPRLLRDQILGRTTSSTAVTSLSLASAASAHSTVDGSCARDEFLADGQEVKVGALGEGRWQLSEHRETTWERMCDVFLRHLIKNGSPWHDKQGWVPLMKPDWSS
jgi:hypothetical protein